jgi:hypothetical protein
MSKPVPVHAGSSRPRSPGFVLLAASQCLTASRMSLPVHDVFTTVATTLGRQQHQPAGNPIRPVTISCLTSRPRQTADGRVWPCALVRPQPLPARSPPCRIGALRTVGRKVSYRTPLSAIPVRLLLIPVSSRSQLSTGSVAPIFGLSDCLLCAALTWAEAWLRGSGVNGGSSRC